MNSQPFLFPKRKSFDKQVWRGGKRVHCGYWFVLVVGKGNWVLTGFGAEGRVGLIVLG